MTRIMARLSSMDGRKYTIISLVVLGLMALSLMPLLPSSYIQMWKVFFLGAMWMVAALVTLSGRHVPLSRSAPFALIWGGLNMTIPSLQIINPSESPVYMLGSAIFLFGILCVLLQTAYDLYRRFRVEHGR